MCNFFNVTDIAKPWQESNMPSGIFFDTDFYYIDLYLYYASN